MVLKMKVLPQDICVDTRVPSLSTFLTVSGLKYNYRLLYLVCCGYTTSSRLVSFLTPETTLLPARHCGQWGDQWSQLSRLHRPSLRPQGEEGVTRDTQGGFDVRGSFSYLLARSSSTRGDGPGGLFESPFLPQSQDDV